MLSCCNLYDVVKRSLVTYSQPSKVLLIGTSSKSPLKKGMTVKMKWPLYWHVFNSYSIYMHVHPCDHKVCVYSYNYMQLIFLLEQVTILSVLLAITSLIKLRFPFGFMPVLQIK